MLKRKPYVLTPILRVSVFALAALIAYPGCGGEELAVDDTVDGNANGARESFATSCNKFSDARWPSDWKSLEDELLTLVNEKREAGVRCKRGNVWMPPVKPLKKNSKLTCAARAHSKDLADNGLKAGHAGSDGSNMTTRMKRAGYDPGNATENVSRGQRFAAVLVGNYISSKSSHCKNMMNKRVTEAGVGRYFSEEHGIRWTLDLASPAPDKTCPHDKCSKGMPLNPSCDSCVKKICAADPWCCKQPGGFWDNLCVKQVKSVCNQNC